MKFLAAAMSLWLLFNAFAAAETTRPFDDVMMEAREAFAAEDYAQAALRLDEAQSLRPYSLFLTRNRVLARVLSGDTATAIEIAAAVAAQGLTLEFPGHEGFDRLKAEPAYAAVAAQFEANRRPIGVSKIIREFDETGLLPEAALMEGGTLYVGSVRTGGVFDASDSGLREIAQLGGGVFDLAASADGSVLVAVINNQLAYEKAGENPASASFVAFDVSSGAIRSITDVTESAALLGDIEADGDAFYASDSLTPRLFILERGLKPRVLVEDGRFANLQGLALDAKKKTPLCRGLSHRAFCRRSQNRARR